MYSIHTKVRGKMGVGSVLPSYGSQGTGLSLSVLVVSAFTHWGILPAKWEPL